MGGAENSGIDELGPVDYLVVEFPPGAQNFTGEMAAELVRLSDAGTIRVLDLMILQKAADGSVDAYEIDDTQDAGERCRSVGLGEHLGSAVRQRGTQVRGPVDRDRPDSDPSDRRVDRGRNGRRRRELTCFDRPELRAVG